MNFMEVVSDCRYIVCFGGMKLNAQEIKHQLYVRQWAAELEEFQQSGLSAKEWCEANNIAPSTFSMHRRAVRSAMCTAVEQATGNDIRSLIAAGTPGITTPAEPTTINLAQVHLEHSPSSSAGMHIQFGNASIDVGAGVSTDQLRTLFEVMFHAQ